MMDWQFDRLPKSEHSKVIALYKANDLTELAKIHNAYNLSVNEYCCVMRGVKNHFGWAIENKIIA